MLGTLVNTAAVVLGSSIGLLLKSRFPDRIRSAVFRGIGIFSLAIGISMAIETRSFLIMILSVVLGAITGEYLDIDRWLSGLSEKLKSKLGSSEKRFTEGLMTAFLLFCTGSMTIIGGIQEGMTGDVSLYCIKSLMDGVSSIALASAMGIGVLFSALPLFILQGGITLSARLFGEVVPPEVITEISAVGGLLIVGLGIEILELRRMEIANYLPALVYAGVFAVLLRII
ncbi:MAG: DUF554 domain-containing protein [bacterium]